MALFCPTLWLQSCGLLECISLISAFPGELDIVAAEMAVSGGFAIDGFAQALVTNDRAGSRRGVTFAHLQ